jgi:peptidoglycan/LPS O-acetylase OafA/YrhL
MQAAAQAFPSEPMARARGFAHVRELDGVRGLAAAMVFLHHVCFTTVPVGQWSVPILGLRSLAVWGSYGVDLFFALSGFLITSLLLEARERPGYYHDFYWKRALRILPLYLVCLLGVLLFVPGSRAFVLLSLLFLSNFAHVLHIQGDGPFWTLAIEEQFYLLWPTVVRRRAMDELRRWALAIGIGSVGLRLIAAAFGHHDYNFTFFHCDGLAWGAYVACWFAQREQRAASRWGIGMALVAGILLCVVPQFVVSPQSLASLRAMAFAACARQTGVSLLAAALIALLVTRAGAPLFGVLRRGVLPFFGLISYAMYMLHLYVLQAYDRLRGPVVAGDTLAFAERFVAISAGTLALCLLSRHGLELPAMSLRRFVLRRPAPPPFDDQEHHEEQEQESAQPSGHR